MTSVLPMRERSGPASALHPVRVAVTAFSVCLVTGALGGALGGAMLVHVVRALLRHLAL